MAYGLTNDIKFGTIGQFTAKEFETLLCDELIPFVDQHFLTKPDKWSRASLSAGSHSQCGEQGGECCYRGLQAKLDELFLEIFHSLMRFV
mgnify:FL=1